MRGVGYTPTRGECACISPTPDARHGTEWMVHKPSCELRPACSQREERRGRKQGVRCPAASKAAVVKIDWNSAIIRRSVSMRGMITSW